MNQEIKKLPENPSMEGYASKVGARNLDMNLYFCHFEVVAELNLRE